MLQPQQAQPHTVVPTSPAWWTQALEWATQSAPDDLTAHLEALTGGRGREEGMEPDPAAAEECNAGTVFTVHLVPD
jgi:hypothetical protein